MYLIYSTSMCLNLMTSLKFYLKSIYYRFTPTLFIMHPEQEKSRNSSPRKEKDIVQSQIGNAAFENLSLEAQEEYIMNIIQRLQANKSFSINNFLLVMERQNTGSRDEEVQKRLFELSAYDFTPELFNELIES